MVIKTDTLIIGAGVIGSSVAMHIAKLGARDIRMVDFDLEGSWSSSELNAGGVRATWHNEVNILISRLSIDYFASVADEIGYRACGYLWLHTPETLPAALKTREKQITPEWPVEAWDVGELARKIPLIDKTDGVAGAIFTPRDGLVNPNLLKNHFRDQAKRLGVVLDDRTLVKASEPSSSGIKVIAERSESPLEREQVATVLSDATRPKKAYKVEYRAKTIINCAGAWAPKIATILGYKTPSYPLRRQVSIFDCRDAELTKYGMIVDTSGVYFHPEASYGLAGYATPDEPRGINFQYDGESFFNEYVWPALYNRSSKFERLKHLTGWAGLYEVSPDESAIIGRVSDNIFEAHSFSGHGVMHSYGAGLALAELIVKGRYETIDASELSGYRFVKGKPVREAMVI